MADLGSICKVATLNAAETALDVVSAQGGFANENSLLK